MKRALIGYTGFVGSNLFDGGFTHRFNSSNIEEMVGQHFDEVVCAGVQAQKWWANLHPVEDWAGISSLLDILRSITVGRFVLISTVDVYPSVVGVNEVSSFSGENHVYGRHRLAVEDFVSGCFSCHHILRLPALFGPGLKKNILFDLVTGHEVEKISLNTSFQYYDLSLLSGDIKKVIDLDLRSLNLVPAPISTRRIVESFFPEYTLVAKGESMVRYDVSSCFGDNWPEGRNGYLYPEEDVFSRLGAFFKTFKKEGCLV